MRNPKRKARLHTDFERMNFMQRHDVSIHGSSYFTGLTQHVEKQGWTLREFCDYGIEYEMMLMENKVTAQEIFFKDDRLNKMEEVWLREHRALNAEELKVLIAEEERIAAIWNKALRGKESENVSKIDTVSVAKK